MWQFKYSLLERWFAHSQRQHNNVSSDARLQPITALSWCKTLWPYAWVSGVKLCVCVCVCVADAAAGARCSLFERNCRADINLDSKLLSLEIHYFSLLHFNEINIGMNGRHCQTDGVRSTLCIWCARITLLVLATFWCDGLSGRRHRIVSLAVCALVQGKNGYKCRDSAHDPTLMHSYTHERKHSKLRTTILSGLIFFLVACTTVWH